MFVKKPYFKTVIMQDDKRDLIKDNHMLFTKLVDDLEILGMNSSLEKTQCIMKLQEACMWASRAIALTHRKPRQAQEGQELKSDSGETKITFKKKKL